MSIAAVSFIMIPIMGNIDLHQQAIDLLEIMTLSVSELVLWLSSLSYTVYFGVRGLKIYSHIVSENHSVKLVHENPIRFPHFTSQTLIRKLLLPSFCCESLTVQWCWLTVHWLLVSIVYAMAISSNHSLRQWFTIYVMWKNKPSPDAVEAWASIGTNESRHILHIFGYVSHFLCLCNWKLKKYKLHYLKMFKGLHLAFPWTVNYKLCKTALKY